MTQKERVINKLNTDGYISNLWAISQGIWRLGHVIWQIRDEELIICFNGNLLGKENKNYYYFSDFELIDNDYKVRLEGKEYFIEKKSVRV
jgi:hypothetical protein